MHKIYSYLHGFIKMKFCGCSITYYEHNDFPCNGYYNEGKGFDCGFDNEFLRNYGYTTYDELNDYNFLYLKESINDV